MEGQRGQARKGDATAALKRTELFAVPDSSTEYRRTTDGRSRRLLDAWRSHLKRAEDTLQQDWQASIRTLVADRSNGLAKELTAEQERKVTRDLEDLQRNAAKSAVQSVTEILNGAAFQIRAASTREDWTAALLVSASQFAPRAALLSVRTSEAPYSRGVMDLDSDSGNSLPSEPIPLCYAPALLSALESGQPVTAMRSGAEISVALENMLGPGGDRVQVFPIMAHGAPFALLYTEDPSDGNALNVLATVAGLTAETRRAFTRQISYERPAAANATPRPSTWNDLPREHQELHLRAQRFARTQAAELRLYRAEQVREGRAVANLYGVLQQPIDEARRQYQAQFVTGCESMVDYLHVELVKTLANNDARLLGGGYPGPLQ